MKTHHKVVLGVIVVASVTSAVISRQMAAQPVYLPQVTHTDTSPKIVSTRRTGPMDVYPPGDVPGTVNRDIDQSNVSQTICNPSWSTKSIRPPVSYTSKLKIQDMARYGLPGSLGDYELDHLISLELGGNPKDPTNLWMEPYNASIPDGGAKVKDTVENTLHKEVCAGTITLIRAQTIIATDWYACHLSLQNGKPCL